MSDIQQSLREMEDALERLEQSPDIWQNQIIKALCRAVWILLTKEAKRK